MLVTKPNTSHSSLRPLGWYFVVLCMSLSIGCGGGGGGATGSSGDGSSALTITSSSALSALENQTSISTISASNTATYSLGGTDSSLLNIVSNTGVLTFKLAPDFEMPIDVGKNNTYVFSVTANDGTTAVTKNFTVTVTDNTSDNRGSIVSDTFYFPFTRHLDVRNLRIFSRSEVANAFIETVASTYEAMLVNTSSIDIAMRNTFLDTLKNYSVYQRLGYIGGSNYPPESECNVDASCISAIAGGSYLHNVVDYIWEVPGATDANTLNGVLEHLLHTITSVGFKRAFPFEWGFNQSSPLDVATQEAIDKGVYDVSGYSHILHMDPALYRQITAQEYAYWLITAEWDLFGLAGLVGHEEFSISTPAGIETTLPLGHKLYQDTVAKVLSVPDKEILTSLFF